MRAFWPLPALLLCVIAGARGDNTIDFSGLGQKLLAAGDAKRPSSEAKPEETDLGDKFLHSLLPLHHRLRLGAVEIWIPRESLRSSGDRGPGAALATITNYASLALKLERAWVERLNLDDKTRESAKKALNALDAWVRGWKESDLGKTKPEIEAALQTIRDLFAEPTSAPSSAPGQGDPAKTFPHAPVLLVGLSRADFVSLLGAAGVLDASQQSRLWLPAVRTWLSGGLFVGVSAVGLSYGPQGDDGPALVDNPMSGAESSPQVVHQVSHLLITQLVPEAPTWLQEGLALNDTIETTRSDETRCTGSAKGNVVAEVSGFQGGQVEDFRIIPGMPAELSPYRRGPSAGFFVKELRRAKTPEGFKVGDFKSGKIAIITGPFLLPQEKMPEKVSHGDEGLKSGYAEFFRAYVGAFGHFLGEQKIDKKPLVAALVRELRDERAKSPPTPERFHDVLQKLTGRSLGKAADPKKDWEAAFGAWLETKS